MEAVHRTREAWPEPVRLEDIRPPDDEEEWAANPWQAQVDAHIMQLQQAAGNRYGQVLGGSGSVAFGVPAMICGVPLPSQAQQLSHGGVAAEVVGNVAAVTCTPAAGREELWEGPGAAGTANSDRPPDEFASRVSELEGHIALLEDTLMRKDKELEELHLQLQLGGQGPEGHIEQPPESQSSAVDASELQRKNEFLSMLVTRFEKKTMDLEEEIVSLTLAKRDYEVESPEFAREGSRHGSSSGRVNELEGQVALLDDIVAQKDGELKELRQQLRNCRECREDAEQQDTGLRAEVQQLKERDAFLSGLVARFEEKTMKLEQQVSELASARHEAKICAEQAAVQQEELRAARSEAAELREEKQAAHTRTAELLRANAAAAETIEEHRQAAESSALALRDCKKDHNAKAQDLLRRMQMLEKQKRDLESENKRLESAVDVPASASTEEVPPTPVLEELRELKLLNAQLIERLGKERSEHAQSRQHMQSMSGENETLTCRLDCISEQLYESVVRNDSLQEELTKLRQSIGHSHPSSIPGEDLHSMS